MVGGRLAGYRHRHHAGPHGHLRHDEEWGLFLATTGDRYLATSGDFFMATDKWCSAVAVIVPVVDVGAATA